MNLKPFAELMSSAGGGWSEQWTMRDCQWTRTDADAQSARGEGTGLVLVVT